MGIDIEREDFEEADFLQFSARLRQCLNAMGEILGRPGFGVGPASIGAELEFSIVDQAGKAMLLGETLLEEIDDRHLQLEIDRFNIEYNLSPAPMRGAPFSTLEAEMNHAIGLLNRGAVAHDARVVPIGILPTLTETDLEPHVMSNVARFRALSRGLRRTGKSSFDIVIDGEDPLVTSCTDVTREGAATSLQVHLRVNPDQFAATYNACQMATPLVLALAANSPTFLGHRLWDETRVSLFKQAVDSRLDNELEWSQPARVGFGHGWVREGAYEVFAEAVELFRPLVPLCGDGDPAAALAAGEVPDLPELRLHHGTVWRWNRAVFDSAGDGHLRIEMRVLPAGPTPIDMVSNIALLVGLTLGLRDGLDRMLPAFPFKYAKYNFYRAAQYGVSATLLWPSDPPSPREVDVCELVSDLLPVAERGLASVGVEGAEIKRLMDVIRERLETRRTGAAWQRAVLAHFDRDMERPEALAAMLQAYLRESATGRPVAQWSERP